MRDLPEDAADEAERLTRLARQSLDDEEGRAYRDERDELLAEYDFVSRVREDEEGDVLVCYPEEWIGADRTVVPDRIDDVDRGVERRLSGAGDPDDWETVDSHNQALVERVAADHGPEHAANARSLAEFASNHYAKQIEELARTELREFLEEYYPRNVWPGERQRALLEESVRVTFEKTDTACPLDG